MSEQSQGPGWWLASDGKWYPPEQAPAAPPPSTEQIGAPPPGGPPAGPPGAAPPAGPPGGPPIPPPGPGVPIGPGGPPPGAPVTPRSNNTAKIVAVIVALALVAGGVAFALTRDSGSGGSTKAFCDTAKKFQNDDSLSKAGNDPEQIDKAIAAFDELVKASPKEIKPDVETLSDAVKKFGAAIKAAGSDPDKQFAAVLAAAASLDQEKLEKATNNIEEFGKKNCGADFSFDSSDSSDSSNSSSGFSSSFSFGSDFSFDSDSFSSVLSSFSSDFGSDFFSSLSSEFSDSTSS